MFELIIALILGCLAGTITGLIPGIHTNTIAIMVLAGMSILHNYFSLLGIGVFLVSMVIVHSFLDFIPSLFFGAPEAETVLGVLPGHEMLLKGEGYKALKLTIVGGVGSFLIGIAMLPLIFIFLEKGYPYFTLVIPWILIIFSSIFILIEKEVKGKAWALIIFLLSGVLGLLTLNHLDLKNPLFPLLTGLFGISTLIISMLGRNKIVKQKLDDKINFLSKSNIWNWLKASLSASIVSILPAIGAAQATVIAHGFTKLKNHEDYLVTIGGINTVSALFVLTTLFLVGKARTGVMATLKQVTTLDFHAYLVLFAACFVAIGIGALLTMKLGKVIAANIWKVNYRKLSFGIIIFLLILIGLFSSWMGLLIVSVAISIGVLAPKVGVKRIHAMGCLILPVVFYFL